MPLHIEKTKHGLIFFCENNHRERPKCYKCGKPATKYCDHRSYDTYTYTDEYGRKRKRDVASLFQCSKPICDDCALSEDDMDFCQGHGDYYQTVLVTIRANEIYEDMIKRLDSAEKSGRI